MEDNHNNESIVSLKNINHAVKSTISNNSCNEDGKSHPISSIKQLSLANLLSKFEKVDLIAIMKELGWKQKYDKDGNPVQPAQKHFKVVIVQQIMEVAKYHNLHLIYDFQKFYIYSGTQWIELEEAELFNFLKNGAIRLGYSEIESRENKFVDQLLKQAEKDGFFEEKFDNRGAMINLKNCTLVLGKNGITTKEFDYRDFLTHQLLFNYDINAKNELFLQYLDDVLPDVNTQRTLQEVTGYLFLKGLKLEISIFLFGTGANGKSVFFEILSGIIGPDNMCNFSLESLTDQTGYSRAEIQNKIVNYGTDIDLKKINPSIFKALSSGEPVEARSPYGRPYKLENYAKLIFNVNKLEHVNIENTKGFFRRMLIIPFHQDILESKKDIFLHKKILQNPEGVLNWAIEGAQRVIENEAIFISDECKDFKKDFIKESDIIFLFIDSKNYIADDTSFVALKCLYQEYKSFCKEDGYKTKGKINFSKDLELLKFRKVHNRENIVGFRMSEKN